MLMMTRSNPSQKTCEPKYLTPRTPNRPTFGHQTIAVAEALGQPPMPWQQHWMLVTGEMVRDEETGIWVPAYPECFATVMRQQGKTLGELAAELQRATLWEAWDGKPQAIAYSGQSGSMGRQKFRKEHWPLIRASKMHAAVSRPRFAAEDTGLDFVNGSTLTIWSTSEDAGHSLTVDMVCMDEIWADQDDRREQASIPAMATRHDSQSRLTSTGGTDKSVLYLRKQAAGRAAVTAGRREGIAYAEWAFDPKDDPEDPRTWWANMPALGYTITERTVQNALDKMRQEDGNLDEFKRAWGNITKRTFGEQVISEELWKSVLHDAPLAGRMVVAADAVPDQSSASVAVASEGVVEVHRHDSGTSWLLDELVKAWKTMKTPVVVDKYGPVAHLIPQLKAKHVKVLEFDTNQVKRSCALILERIADRRISVRPVKCAHCDRVSISDAVAGAVRQPQGDGWKWSRKSTDVDISPLMAASLAVGGISGVGNDPELTSVPVAFV